MAEHARLILAQCNFCVGDIIGNTEKIVTVAKRALGEFKADAVVFPELAITGYPPEDLLFRPGLHRGVAASLKKIADAVRDINIFVGYPEIDGDSIYNSCAVFYGGNLISNYRKQALPNYAVFDEKRYFKPGAQSTIVEIAGIKVGVNICEDIWSPESAIQAKDAGAEMLCNINASPFHIDKQTERLEAVGAAVNASGLPIAYVNTVGGQDELIFDGGSFVIDTSGTVSAQAGLFKEDLVPIDVFKSSEGITVRGPQLKLADTEQTIYEALVLGVKDYIEKNRFRGCVIGLSGGIDSALTLTIAVDALGSDHVVAISMPSKYTADMSIEDARSETQALGCDFHIVPIDEPVSAFTKTLGKLLGPSGQGVTAENIQARSRGVILMAVSNTTGHIVLATGNKSEMAVGYATLYGDMAGGFAPLKDIPKTMVYRLAKWRNRQGHAIPNRVLDRAPTAELAPAQKDSDSLPPYDVLDPILEHYIEADMSPREIVEQGYDLESVNRVTSMVDRNEYKRRQAASGIRITKRAFGRDRRFPITSRYSEQEIDGTET